MYEQWFSFLLSIYSYYFYILVLCNLLAKFCMEIQEEYLYFLPDTFLREREMQS